jgi:hypothetical protein
MDSQTEQSIQVVKTIMRHQLVVEIKLQSYWECLLLPIQASIEQLGENLYRAITT